MLEAAALLASSLRLRDADQGGEHPRVWSPAKTSNRPTGPTGGAEHRYARKGRPESELTAAGPSLDTMGRIARRTMEPVRTCAPQSVSTAKRPVKPRVSRAKPVDALLDLQRAAGNAAVVAHLADVRSGNSAAPHLLPIQRCGPTPCDCSDAERTGYAVTHGEKSVVQRDVTDDLAALIAKDLAEYTAQNRNPFPHIREVFHRLDSDIEDNVAAAFVERLGPQLLEVFAETDDGRKVMDLLTEAMLTGHVTSFEALQADRILAARSGWMSADEHEKAVRRIAALRRHAEDTGVEGMVNELALKAATSLAAFAAGRRYDEVTTILRGTDSNVEDNVASHLIELLTTPQLEEAAEDPAGVTMLDVCYDALITGTVTSFESFQGDRILAARVKGRNIGAGEVEKVLQNPTIFPLETSWGSSATIVASLETNGTVKVYYDTWTGASQPKYAKDMDTLTARFGQSQVFSGMVLQPDEIVMVKLYDQDEQPHPIPAIKLIDLANRQLQDFEGKFEKVTILGATVGLGAVGGAGVLGMLDTAAFAISTASTFIDAYRSDIAKTAGGSAFLEVWDVVQGVADLYGWGRLGADGLHLLRAKVTPALRSWRAERLTGLSDAERATIGQAQREADKWVGGVEQAEAAEAKNLREGEHPHADEGGDVHPGDAHEPAAPHGGDGRPAVAHEASRAVGEAGIEREAQQAVVRAERSVVNELGEAHELSVLVDGRIIRCSSECEVIASSLATRARNITGMRVDRARELVVQAADLARESTALAASGLPEAERAAREAALLTRAEQLERQMSGMERFAAREYGQAAIEAETKMRAFDAAGGRADLSAADQAWLTSDPRHPRLAFDPGGNAAYRIEEARSALEAEATGALTPPVRRSFDSGADFVDGAGRPWSFKGTAPAAVGATPAQVVSGVVEEARATRDTVADLRHLSSADQATAAADITHQLSSGGAHAEVRFVPPIAAPIPARR